MLRAITRQVSRSVERCELTHLQRQPIDLERARQQHRAYEAALGRLGCAVEQLAEEPELPDSVFVEDVALVLDEVAVILRPGAASRRPEVAGVARALGAHRELLPLPGRGTVDGGDVLRLGRTLYVGRSSRSSPAGCDALRRLVAPLGYTVREVSVRGCLHLKSAVTAVAPDTLLANRAWVDAAPFSGYRLVDVDPREPQAGNALRVGGAAILYPSAFPATAARLEALGLPLEPVDLSELARAEGAVTCCSLVFAA